MSVSGWGGEGARVRANAEDDEHQGDEDEALRMLSTVVCLPTMCPLRA
jgi:hypothetical protein